MLNSLPVRLPPEAESYLLLNASERQVVSARRVHLLELLWRERYVTLASLVWRVEIIMAYACFGEESWDGSFHKEGRA